MEDIGSRITNDLNELIRVHLHSIWRNHLIDSGIDPKEAYTWTLEISEVLDEIRTTLKELITLFNLTDPKQIPIEVHGWAIRITIITVPEIQQPMTYLAGLLEKYLPEDPPHDDTDDDKD